MDNENCTQLNRDTLKTVLNNLRRNNMSAQDVEHKKDVAGVVATLLNAGDTISVGGSVTLEETKVLDLVKEQKYCFIDRYEEGLSAGEQKQRLVAAFTADVFLCSANAITQASEIFQVDGLSNRIAPLAFGPDRVIIVAGINKIVKNIEEAVLRVRTIAAPAIVKRRHLSAPCGRLGSCAALNSQDMAAGCQCDDRRCCTFLIMGRQRIKDRISVIIVGEALGFKKYPPLNPRSAWSAESLYPFGASRPCQYVPHNLPYPAHFPSIFLNWVDRISP